MTKPLQTNQDDSQARTIMQGMEDNSHVIRLRNLQRNREFGSYILDFMKERINVPNEPNDYLSTFSLEKISRFQMLGEIHKMMLACAKNEDTAKAALLLNDFLSKTNQLALHSIQLAEDHPYQQMLGAMPNFQLQPQVYVDLCRQAMKATYIALQSLSYTDHIQYSAEDPCVDEKMADFKMRCQKMLEVVEEMNQHSTHTFQEYSNRLQGPSAG